MQKYLLDRSRSSFWVNQQVSAPVSCETCTTMSGCMNVPGIMAVATSRLHAQVADINSDSNATVGKLVSSSCTNSLCLWPSAHSLPLIWQVCFSFKNMRSLCAASLSFFISSSQWSGSNTCLDLTCCSAAETTVSPALPKVLDPDKCCGEWAWFHLMTRYSREHSIKVVHHSTYLCLPYSNATGHSDLLLPFLSSMLASRFCFWDVPACIPSVIPSSTSDVGSILLSMISSNYLTGRWSSVDPWVVTGSWSVAEVVWLVMLLQSRPHPHILPWIHQLHGL